MTFWQYLAGKVKKNRSKVSNFDSKVLVFWQLLLELRFFNKKKTLAFYERKQGFFYIFYKNKNSNKPFGE
jgi:hypothetical protein